MAYAVNCNLSQLQIEKVCMLLLQLALQCVQQFRCWDLSAPPALQALQRRDPMLSFVCHNLVIG